jgi:glycogen synthase
VAEARSVRLAVLVRSMYPLHGLGGLERHAYDLVRSHLAHGLSVWLVTRPGRPADARAREAWGALERTPGFSCSFVPYRTFPFAGRRGTTILDRSTAYPLFGARAGRLVAGRVAEGGVDVVYALGASGWGYARAKRRGARAPLVLNPQGLEEFGGFDGRYGGQPLKRIGYGPLRRVVDATAAAADVVLVTDRALEPTIARHLGVEAARLRLVPNAIDVAACRSLAGPADGAALRERFGIPSGEMVLLSAGRLERNKGFHVLASALSGWHDRPGWTWVLAGQGPDAGRIDEAIDAAGISRAVRRVGRVGDDELHAWYEAADLFVHPTVYEGSSLVTLEAMAHGKPVLATRAGGLPDKVRPGETGWLVAPGDPASLAAGLDEAAHARGAWTAMGEAGRRLVESTFDWPVVEGALRSIYEELLARRTDNGRGWGRITRAGLKPCATGNAGQGFGERVMLARARSPSIHSRTSAACRSAVTAARTAVSSSGRPSVPCVRR